MLTATSPTRIARDFDTRSRPHVRRTRALRASKARLYAQTLRGSARRTHHPRVHRIALGCRRRHPRHHRQDPRPLRGLAPGRRRDLPGDGRGLHRVRRAQHRAESQWVFDLWTDDPTNGCKGTSVAAETGISTASQRDVGIRGPGVVRQFQGDGILFMATAKGWVQGVTTTTNCLSGIRVNPTSSGISVENNVSVRNGSAANPCGGI